VELEQEGNQRPGVAAVGFVIGAECCSHRSFFHADLAPVRQRHNHQRDRRVNFAFNSILFAYRWHGWGSDGWLLASAVTLRDLVSDKCIFSFAIQYVTTMLIDPCLSGDLAGPFFVSVGVDRT